MRIDPKAYERAKNRNRVTITKNADNPTTHVDIRIEYYDHESGTTDPVTETVSLQEVQDTRQKTHQERTRLDTIITDITAVLTAP